MYKNPLEEKCIKMRLQNKLERGEKRKKELYELVMDQVVNKFHTRYVVRIGSA